MEIRKAGLEDLETIMGIYDTARAFMRQQGNPDQWKGGHPSEALIREDIQGQELYLCVEGEEILAVFYFAPGPDPTYLRIDDGKWLNDEPYHVIHRIAVAQQGRGVVRFCFDY